MPTKHGKPEVNIDPNKTCQFAAEDELTVVVDTTTDPAYVFYAQTWNENAATTDACWRCFRITVANGTKLWATNPVSSKKTRAFELQASAAATYTY